MLLQLNPAIPLWHVEKGNFLAHLVHDYGIESEILFTGIVEATGEIWTFNNKVLRGQKNITMGREFKNEDSKNPRA
jgi:hypothetical protein